jgi:hypothetical protein
MNQEVNENQHGIPSAQIHLFGSPERQEVSSGWPLSYCPDIRRTPVPFTLLRHSCSHQEQTSHTFCPLKGLSSQTAIPMHGKNPVY